jgi:hypothetical protein
MQAIVQIKEWVLDARPDFELGVKLFQEVYPQQKHFIRILSFPNAHQNRFNHDKLYIELKNYYIANKHLLANLKEIEKPIPTIETPKIEEPELVVNIPSGGTKKSRYPEALHKYIDEQAKLYKERDYTFYRAQAGAIKGKKNLSMAAKFLLNTERRIREIWECLDYYDRHQSILPKFVDADAQNVGLYLSLERRLNTVRTYVTRYKQKQLDHPDDEKVKTNLFKYLNEVQLLESQLGRSERSLK